MSFQEIPMCPHGVLMVACHECKEQLEDNHEMRMRRYHGACFTNLFRKEHAALCERNAHRMIALITHKLLSSFQDDFHRVARMSKELTRGDEHETGLTIEQFYQYQQGSIYSCLCGTLATILAQHDAVASLGPTTIPDDFWGELTMVRPDLDLNEMLMDAETTVRRAHEKIKAMEKRKGGDRR